MYRDAAGLTDLSCEAFRNILMKMGVLGIGLE